MDEPKDTPISPVETLEVLSKPPLGIGAKSTRGFVYLLSGTITAKLISLLGQIALSYLLSERDFGVVALAITVTAFFQILENAGMGDVLVQRRRFRLWAVPGFWFAVALGATSSAMSAISAPIAAAIYGDSQLTWLILVLSVAPFFNSLSIVPRAQLSRELCFRTLAVANVASIAIRTGLSVLFAVMGFGPFSFVLPVPITSAVVSGFLWWWAKPPWELHPRFGRWKHLVGHSSILLASEWVRVGVEQSDYILLGLFQSKVIVGLYWFGYSFATQMLQFVSLNVMNILFPTLVKLNHRPQEQYRSFLRAQEVLAAVGISSSLLQAAVADPLTRLVFDPKWIPSIVVMQLLSLGMATRSTAHSSIALLKARAQFHRVLHCMTLFLVAQVCGLVLVLALGGSMVSVAVVVAVVSTLVCPLFVYAAVRLFGGGWREVGQVLARPAVCGLLSVGTAWLVAQGMARAGFGSLAQLVVTVILATALNLFLARVWMRTLWDEVWNRVQQVIPFRARA